MRLYFTLSIILFSFILIQCGGSKSTTNDYEGKDIIIIPDNSQDIPGEILVEIFKNKKVESLVTDMDKYRLSVIRKVSPSLNIFLLYYDMSAIDPDKMLKMIKKHESVKSAEFNKKISTRE
ncbi:MAG: hypothetical protein HKN92_08815 [Chitinophagales bacterium]|nr:hypothetical protein [Chitinophagales bacterium]